VAANNNAVPEPGALLAIVLFSLMLRRI